MADSKPALPYPADVMPRIAAWILVYLGGLSLLKWLLIESGDFWRWFVQWWQAL
jgi:hypothetical protein